MHGRLTQLGGAVGALLKDRKHTIAVSESSAGGLINAALVAAPGASAYYLGGAIVYTVSSRENLLQIKADEMNGMRSASEPYAALLAKTVRANLGATWGLSETGNADREANMWEFARRALELLEACLLQSKGNS